MSQNAENNNEPKSIILSRKLSGTDLVKIIKLNEMSGRIELSENSKYINGLHKGNFKDVYYTRVGLWFSETEGKSISTATVAEAIANIAETNSYCPLKQFINSLPAWDGSQRLDRWLHYYCGAEDNEYNNIVGRKFVLQLINRALNPGCKADYTLILEGSQGTYKSTILSVLCGEEFFSDCLPSLIDNKTAIESIRRSWIVEIAELNAFTGMGSDLIKSFLTRQVDSIRPAYGREVVDYPRRCVFVGTTNRDVYLNDSTGNRRFWPVKTNGSAYGVEIMRRDRLQLLAEAKEAWQMGEKAFFDETEWDKLSVYVQAAQEERRVEDPWEDLIDACLVGKTEICSKDIFDYLGLEGKNTDNRHTKRVAKIMKTMKWKRKLIGKNRLSGYAKE